MTENHLNPTQTLDEQAIQEAQAAADRAFIQQRLDENYREELRQMIEPYHLTAYDHLPPLKPVIKRYDSLICSEGNISAVVGEQSVVEPQYCRNTPFERFAFRVEEVADAKYIGERAIGLDLPVECDLPADMTAKEDECVRILRDELGGVAERKLLVSKVEQMLNITHNYAKVKVHRAVDRGLLRMIENECVSVA